MNRPLNAWTYDDPGLPCDLCAAPMHEDRTRTRCDACVGLVEALS